VFPFLPIMLFTLGKTLDNFQKRAAVRRSKEVRYVPRGGTTGFSFTPAVMHIAVVTLIGVTQGENSLRISKQKE